MRICGVGRRKRLPHLRGGLLGARGGQLGFEGANLLGEGAVFLLEPVESGIDGGDFGR